jgi:hypothetical protein
MDPGPADSECLVSWMGADDEVTSIGPFSRARAEILVQVYGRMYPTQTCWVEALPPAVSSLHLGRARRHVGIPRLAAPDGEH